jgi:hypothetical protein
MCNANASTNHARPLGTIFTVGDMIIEPSRYTATQYDIGSLRMNSDQPTQ